MDRVPPVRSFRSTSIARSLVLPLYLSIGAAVGVLVACGSGSSGPVGPAGGDTTVVDAGTDTLRRSTDTAVLPAGAGDGTVLRYVVLKATSGLTYHLQVLPRGVFQMQVVSLPDSVLQPSRPQAGDTLAFPCSRTGNYRIRISGPAGTSPQVQVWSTFALPSGWIAADSYEPDDSAGQERELLVGTTGQSRTLHGDTSLTTDIDRIALWTDSGVTYRIRIDAAHLPDLAALAGDGTRLAAPPGSDSAGTRTWTFPSTRAERVILRVSGDRATAYRIQAVRQTGWPAWYPKPDAWESDDVPARAVMVPLGDSTFKRTLTPRDVDWFRIVGDSGGVVTGNFATSNPGTPALTAVFLDRDSNQVLSLDVKGSSNPFSRSFSRPETLLVRLKRSDTALEIPYSAQFDRRSGRDPYEPDGRPSLAWKMPLDSVVRSREMQYMDTDWVRLDVPAGNWLHLRVHTPGSGTTLVVRPMRVEGTRSDSAPAYAFYRPDTTFNRNVVALRDTTVFLRFTHSGWSAQVSDMYTLQGWLTRLPVDPFEPDDLPGTGSILPTDSTWATRYLVPGDTDRMKLPLVANTVCEFETESPDWTGGSFDPAVSLLDPAGKSIQSLRNGGFFVTRTAGAYQVRIVPHSGLDTVQAYGILAKCAPNPDSYEPDEGIHTAWTLPMDSVARTRTLTSGDNDWIRVPYRRGMLRFASVDANFSYSWEVRHADSSACYGCTVRRTDFSTSGVQLTGSTDTSDLFFHVPSSSYWYSGRPFTPYQVRGWYVPDPDTFEVYDQPATAPLLGTSPLSRRFGPGGDIDLFRIHLEAGQTVQFLGTGNPKITSYFIPKAGYSSTFPANGRLHADTATDYVVNVCAQKDTTADLPYALWVQNTSDSGNTTSSVDMNLTLLPADGAWHSMATTVATYSNSLFKLQPGVSYLVEARGPQYIDLRVISEDRSFSKTFSDSLAISYTSTTDSQIQVGALFSGAPVSFQVRVTPVPPDTEESSDSPTGARLLAAGEKRSRVLGLGDTDYVWIDPQSASGFDLTVVGPLTTSTTIDAKLVDKATGKSVGYDPSFGYGHMTTTPVPLDASRPFLIRLYADTYTFQNPHQGALPYTISYTPR